MQNFNDLENLGNCGVPVGSDYCLFLLPIAPDLCAKCWWPFYNDAGYPDHWDAIALAAKCRARWRCEHCNHPHDPKSGHTLTVHHLDGDKSNCAPENLVALCQRCHLTLQALYRPGQTVMPFAVTSWMQRCKVPILSLNGDPINGK